jgi:uncharacterized C2H2 Zn-finger protein
MVVKCKLCGVNIKDDKNMIEHRKNKHTWDEVGNDDMEW